MMPCRVSSCDGSLLSPLPGTASLPATKSGSGVMAVAVETQSLPPATVSLTRSLVCFFVCSISHTLVACDGHGPEVVLVMVLK